MDAVTLISAGLLLLVGALVVYLLFSLIRPERF